jgi:peptidoglycan hydrolase-like protein with peptidoglycan-binding domain
VVIQVELNRIAQNYPSIPKLASVDGIFGSRTEASVRRFQEIFDLTPDGVVGKATWYALVRLYTAVTRLSELRSQGQQFYAINWEYPDPIQEGDTGDKVRHLQYMLSVLSAYIKNIPDITVDGIFGPATRDAVLAAQRWFGLPETGQVDNSTWDEIYDQFAGIENTSLRDGEVFPAMRPTNGARQVAVQTFAQNNRTRYSQSTTLTQFPGEDLRSGRQDPVSQEVIR